MQKIPRSIEKTQVPKNSRRNKETEINLGVTNQKSKNCPVHFWRKFETVEDANEDF
jgi:hypothetical protein